jgi:hypothetical protein
MILYATKASGPIPGHDDLYKTNITGRRTALCLTWGWVAWEPQLQRSHGEFEGYNAPAGWAVGFMRPFLRPGVEVFAWDGVALCAFTFGWFRINWSRWATQQDMDRA